MGLAVDGVKEFLNVHLYHDTAILAMADGFIGTAQRLMR